MRENIVEQGDLLFLQIVGIVDEQIADAAQGGDALCARPRLHRDFKLVN